MSNELKYLVPMLDAGHGYIIKNTYQTAGKRSPLYPEGVLYEGVSNRHFIAGIAERLVNYGVPFILINPEDRDITLETRVRRANKEYAKDKNTYLYSMHSNAGGGTGIEAWTSKGQTKSDELAEVFLTDLETGLTDTKFRFDYLDKDKDKERQLYLLRNTNCPAVLMEILFMDYKPDFIKLNDPEYRSCVMDITANSMKNLYYGIS